MIGARAFAWMAVAVWLLAAGVAAAVDPVGAPAEDGVRGMTARGQQCLRERRWAEAADWFERARRQRPGYEPADFGLGVAWIEQREYGKALRLFTMLAERYPGDASVKNNLACVLVRSTDPAVRDPAKALRLARQAVLDLPDDPNVWATVAEAHYELAQYEAAWRAVRIAVRTARLRQRGAEWEFWDLYRRCRRRAPAGAADAGEAPEQDG